MSEYGIDELIRSLNKKPRFQYYMCSGGRCGNTYMKLKYSEITGIHILVLNKCIAKALQEQADEAGLKIPTVLYYEDGEVKEYEQL